MKCSGRFIIIHFDTSSFQGIDNRFSSHIFLGTCPKKKIMDFFVKISCILKHSIIASFYVKSKYSRTEAPYIGKFVEIGECYIKSLMTSPGQSGHSPIVTVSQRTKLLINHRNQILYNNLFERCPVLCHSILTTLSFCRDKRCLYISVVHNNDHWYTLISS